MPKAFPLEFRRDVVAVARQSDASIAQVARNLGISESYLQRWLKLDDVEKGRRPVVTQAESTELREAKKSLVSKVSSPVGGSIRVYERYLVTTAIVVTLVGQAHFADREDLARPDVSVPDDSGANAGLQMTSRIAEIAVATDCIDDFAVCGRTQWARSSTTGTSQERSRRSCDTCSNTWAGRPRRRPGWSR